MTWIIYFFIYHFCLLGMYRLFIVANTNYQFQRFYLLLALPVALGLTFLPEHTFSFVNEAVKPVVILQGFTGWDDYHGFEIANTIDLSEDSTFWTFINWKWIYAMVSILFVGKMLIGINYILRLKNRGKVEKKTPYQVFNIENVHPFSFWKWIFIDKAKLNKEEIEMIISHEQHHLVQGHTMDLSIHQLYQIFFWWNPLLYLQGYWTRLNLELMADKATLKEGVDVYQYGQLMIRMATNPLLSASYFAQKPLKIRIMNLSKSPKNKLVAYLLLPIIMGTLFISLSAFKNRDFAPEATTPANFDLLKIIANDLLTKSEVNALFNPIFPIERGIKYRISSTYGYRMHPILKEKKMHNGIDIVAVLSTPIIAVEGGTVIDLGFQPNGYGKFVIIDHGNGYISRYAQLASQTVKKGDVVKQSEQIGTLGSSGRSTGPHLHFEIKKDGQSIDPMLLIKKEE